jgi:hypothetical protein
VSSPLRCGPGCAPARFNSAHSCLSVMLITPNTIAVCLSLSLSRLFLFFSFSLSLSHSHSFFLSYTLFISPPFHSLYLSFFIYLSFPLFFMCTYLSMYISLFLFFSFYLYFFLSLSLTLSAANVFLSDRHLKTRTCLLLMIGRHIFWAGAPTNSPSLPMYVL